MENLIKTEIARFHFLSDFSFSISLFSHFKSTEYFELFDTK